MNIRDNEITFDNDDLTSSVSNPNDQYMEIAITVSDDYDENTTNFFLLIGMAMIIQQLI